MFLSYWYQDTNVSIFAKQSTNVVFTRIFERALAKLLDNPLRSNRFFVEFLHFIDKTLFISKFAISPQFCPIFNVGRMNLGHDFVQVSKLSEDQKKKVFTKNGTLFSPNSDEDQKKRGLHQKWNTFFPRIQVDTYAQMHTRVKLLEAGWFMIFYKMISIHHDIAKLHMSLTSLS